MVLQKFVKKTLTGALVRSRKGITYQAILEDNICLNNADYLEIEFQHSTPTIVGIVEKVPSATAEEIQKQEKEILTLGGDY